MKHRFRLTNEPGALGLSCSASGLALAGVALLDKGENGFTPRSAGDVEALLKRAYPEHDGPIDLSSGLAVVASALNTGDLTKAMIAAVFLKLPELDWDGAVRIARAEEALAKYDPAQPRDWHGRWTTRDGAHVAANLLARSHRPKGVDTRQLAADLAELQRSVPADRFQAALKALDGRLSAADRNRLAEDRRLEARMPEMGRVYGPTARAAGEQAVRIEQTAPGMLTVDAVKQALMAIHAARMNPATSSEDRMHLLPAYFGVYTRGVNEGLLSVELSHELVELGLGAMAYDDGALAHGASRGVHEPDLTLPRTGSKKVLPENAPRGATVGSAKRKKYKKTYVDDVPDSDPESEVHHAIPQAALTLYPDLFTPEEIHSPENLRGIPKSISRYIHQSQLGKEFSKFRRKHSNPSRQDLIDYASYTDWKYGEFYIPKISKILYSYII